VAIGQEQVRGMAKIPSGNFKDTFIAAFYMDKTPVTVQ